MSGRQIAVRPGRHFGWWAEGRKSNDKLFMKIWWPTRGIAEWIAGLFGRLAD